MTKLSSFLGGLLVCSAPVCMAKTPQTQSQIDCNWLTVDTTTKTATFELTAGLTQLNGGLNFNGFNDGKLTLTVPANWTVVLKFANHDANLPHSAEVVDTTKPMPAGPVDPPAFARATTVAARLLQGLGSGETGSVRFVANKAGGYLVFCRGAG